MTADRQGTTSGRTAAPSAETPAPSDGRKEIGRLLEELPPAAAERCGEAVDAFLRARGKLKRDRRALMRFFDSLETSGKAEEPSDTLWSELEKGLKGAMGDGPSGKDSRLAGRIKDILLDDTLVSSARHYRDSNLDLMTRWKGEADGEDPASSHGQRIEALKRLCDANEVLKAPGSDRAQVVSCESRAEESETIYRLHVDCSALVTVIKGHLESGRKLDRMEWRFSHGGDVQNPVIRRFLEESGIGEEDIRLHTGKVIDSFMAWKRIMSVRAVKERYREGKAQHVERIKGELRDNYGQYMEQGEIETKAVADEEERRNMATERRIRGILHASTKRG